MLATVEQYAAMLDGATTGAYAFPAINVTSSQTLNAALRGFGEPALFHSHMFDGSTLPLEDNLRRSAKLLEQCRALGILLEVECGVVGGEEDGIGGGDTASERIYTTVEDLLRVTEVLGVDGYLLAATFGHVHGLYAPGLVRLAEILATVSRRWPRRAPARASATSSTARAARRPRTCRPRWPTAS
jgi:fructose/tagatose bisphosphate aldolase